MIKKMSSLSLLISMAIFCRCGSDVDHTASRCRWIDDPQDQWPQIAMINDIEYVDSHHRVAGCSFLLDTGTDTVAATAKHILMFFKSEGMNAVSFGDRLKSWKMYPKNNKSDLVVVDELINEDANEPIDEVPSKDDWLLFSIREGSQNIQPLEFRKDRLVPGEKVYIIGWRYTDEERKQRVYQGNYIRSLDGAILISTEELADNTVPGLSGAPVIDSAGHLIGLMSQKHGKMEQLAAIEYPREILKSISAKRR